MSMIVKIVNFMNLMIMFTRLPISYLNFNPFYTLVSYKIQREWYDVKLRWNPSEYGGLERLYIPSDLIWLPDIVLYNKGYLDLAKPEYKLGFYNVNKEWNDKSLRWDPKEYGNLDILEVPISEIWTPDIVLFNNHINI
ncbi:hypothetical protein KUTeg_018587 [Tegillarca granosa]|uniref:Neurotransmitter-gated ion-channel ligand-binding domain-containing protein n=1 Tax=Tegillarca granosa TaxID=220873 RepID=A0ABQ9EIA4_TEGGR|nr:hypothetical protein KUTeg_018587 [Tegillarca granosa]